MRASQREIGQVMVERCRLPCVRRMTRVAGLRKLPLDVIGIRGALVVTLVTGITLRRRAGILSVRVALYTTHRNVRAREREL